MVGELGVMRWWIEGNVMGEWGDRGKVMVR